MSSGGSGASVALAAAAGFAAGALVYSRVLRPGVGQGDAREPPAPYDGSLDEVSALVRPNIRALQPYRCARDDYEEGVLLDANENAFGPVVTGTSGRTAEGALVKAARGLDLHRYPCPYQRPLKDRVASFRGVGASARAGDGFGAAGPRRNAGAPKFGDRTARLAALHKRRRGCLVAIASLEKHAAWLVEACEEANPKFLAAGEDERRGFRRSRRKAAATAWMSPFKSGRDAGATACDPRG